MIRWSERPKPRLVLDIGVIPTRAAMEARVECGCGRQVIGGRDGLTRREYGAVVLWQARCGCGSDLTVYGIDYSPEGAESGPH